MSFYLCHACCRLATPRRICFHFEISFYLCHAACRHPNCLCIPLHQHRSWSPPHASGRLSNLLRMYLHYPMYMFLRHSSYRLSTRLRMKLHLKISWRLSRFYKNRYSCKSLLLNKLPRHRQCEDTHWKSPLFLVLLENL